MKAILCLPILFASFAAAEQVDDLDAIGRAIGTLNLSGALNLKVPQPDLFSNDGDAASELERLRNTHPPASRMSIALVGVTLGLCPTPTISHQPWGELRTICPTIDHSAGSRPIVFIGPDLALAEGDFSYQDAAAATRTVPLLFVMKKEGNGWKIASLRELAPR
jgi:hypothetical protein